MTHHDEVFTKFLDHANKACEERQRSVRMTVADRLDEATKAELLSLRDRLAKA